MLYTCMWWVLFNGVRSRFYLPQLSKVPPLSVTPSAVLHNIGFPSLRCFLFSFQEHSEDKQYPQKCQDPLLSHLQPLSPGRAHTELRRYYSICQDTAFGPPGFQEGEGELKRDESARNSLSPTMAPKLSLEVRKLSNGRLSTSLKLGPLQPRAVPLREKKATQMLAIVLGEFGSG